MNDIVASSREQATGIGQVNQAITQMDSGTQQNAALVEESAAATRSMQEQASQLAQAMGGRVEVTSREGQGSTFRVLLPRGPQSTMEEAA